jgi:hypothetical protein
MKPRELLLVAFAVAFLSSCATYRDIMADRMNSEAEVKKHVEAECVFLSVPETKCSELVNAAVTLWKTRQYNLDSGAIKQLVVSKLLG